MSAKNKKKRGRRLFTDPAPSKKRNADASEEYTLDAILSDFRASKDLEPETGESVEERESGRDASGLERRLRLDAERGFDAPQSSFRLDTSELDAAGELPDDAPQSELSAISRFDTSELDAAGEPPDDASQSETSAISRFDTSELDAAGELPDDTKADKKEESRVDEPEFDEEGRRRVRSPVLEELDDIPDLPPGLSALNQVADKLYGASGTQSDADTLETESDEKTEIIPDTPSTDAKAEIVTETPSPDDKAEPVTETPSPDDKAAIVPETPSHDDKAEPVTERRRKASDKPTPRHSAPPTLRERLFRRDKPSKEPEETESDAPPRSVSLGEIVGNASDAVRPDNGSRRSLFSRRRLDAENAIPADSEHPEIVGPEPDLKTASDQARREYVKRIEGLSAAIVPAVLPTLVLILEAFGVKFPLLTGSLIVRPLALLACLALTLRACRSAFSDNRCTGAFLCGVSAIAAGLDCLTAPLLSARSMAEPYGAVACLALVMAKVGVSLESRGTYSAFHAASLDANPPYLVTDTVGGARKQYGAVTGFYTETLAQNFASRWQTFILPVTLAASLAFAALSSFGQDRPFDFFLNWSAILAAGSTLVLPLGWGLPWARLSARLKNAGCAIAGWRGAECLSRKKKMIVTDGDLFPPGSVRLEDTRLYEMTMKQAASLTASVIRESGCGLERIFDDLMASEAGDYLPLRDFQFYEDGGFSAVSEGDTVLLGTSSFLRKMSVQFPGDFYFPMGLYLAVNGVLVATFALKYEASENVDYALRMMRRNRVAAILVSRDPNINPKLLQRVFRRRIDVEYPGLNNRLALSVMRKNRDWPRALLFREGLLPYAETVVGSLRLCAGVKRSSRLALFGSAAGTLISSYLVFQSRYYLLTPLNLLWFLLLWTVPVLLLMDLS